jgi:hypothetical protein
MTERGQAANGIDTSKPNVARIYDYLLGGKDNFAVDRAATATESPWSAPTCARQLHLRPLPEITRLFAGFDLVDPGVVWMNEWPRSGRPARRSVLVTAGRGRPQDWVDPAGRFRVDENGGAHVARRRRRDLVLRDRSQD